MDMGLGTRLAVESLQTSCPHGAASCLGGLVCLPAHHPQTCSLLSGCSVRCQQGPELGCFLLLLLLALALPLLYHQACKLTRAQLLQETWNSHREWLAHFLCYSGFFVSHLCLIRSGSFANVGNGQMNDRDFPVSDLSLVLGKPAVQGSREWLSE